jgi:hypothetical protein
VCQWCPNQLHVAFFPAEFRAEGQLHGFPHHLESSC